ncbi:hypothetical protein [Dyadobacter sp. 32]|uniref:hypothetical protein n=1 Tax=Dyadobacter sp. 32 TaxID=538966 RepID=UPI0011ECFE21
MEFHSKIYKIGCTAGRLFFGTLLMLWLMSFGAFGQENLIRITTNVLPPYSPYIQDYPGTGNRVQVFVSNLSGKDLSVRLIGKLEGDNGVVIRTSPNYRPLQPLQLRATDVNRLVTRSELEGLFDLNQIEVQGMNKNELYRGLPLPEGNYQLCIQAFDNATIRPLSAEFPMGCSGLIPVRIIEPPILISPFENEEVITKTPQTQIFTWSAPVGIMPNQVEYTLRIVELPAADVNPNVFIDAVVLPRSGLEVKNLRTSSFLYGPSHPALQVGKKYAWRVQAHSRTVKLNLMNDGKSPVGIFTYGQNNVIPVLEYITMTSPNQSSTLRTKSIEVGNNNPLTFKWDLDKEFEEKLRKAYTVPLRQKNILDHVPALSYQVKVTSLNAKPTDAPVLIRQVRTLYFQLEKEDLPAEMTNDKKFEVKVELLGVTEVKRKQAQFSNEPMASKPVTFSLFAKDLRSEKDTLTITGTLAFKYPGEDGQAHLLPNTKVVLSKLEQSNYLLTVGYGVSDSQGRYTVKVLKSALHGTDTLATFTRCILDAVNPFIQPITSSGAYQTSTENTFQISRNEQKEYKVEGVTWLASGYTLELAAKQTYKNWPGAPDAKLSGQYVVIYRKTTGLQEYYKKFRLPVEGQVKKEVVYNTIPLLSIEQEKEAKVPNTNTLKTGSPALTQKIRLDRSITNISKTVSPAGIDKEKSEDPTDFTEKIKAELKAAGYEFIGISQLKANGDVFSTTFERLVYADKSYDNYRVYCPGCGQKPDDGQAILFLNKKEPLASAPARIEKVIFNIETTEPPTMTFKGKLAYKFADPGQDGAAVLPLGNTQVHLQVVYQETDSNIVTTSIPGNGDETIAAFHQNYSQTLDTRVTSADGSFVFSVKMIAPMPMGILPVTAKTGSTEFVRGGKVYRRTLRVIVDNEHYTSPTADFGIQPDEIMKPQGSFDYQTLIANVKSYKLVANIRSDVTGQLGEFEQKAGMKNTLAGVNVVVLKAASKIPPPGPNRNAPADVGSGVQKPVNIKGKSYTIIASGNTDGQGLVSFPRMAMAATENEAYFLSAFSTIDGLNSSDTLEPRRITETERYSNIGRWVTNPSDKIKNDPKKKTRIVDGSNCTYYWKVVTRAYTNPNGQVQEGGSDFGLITTTTNQIPKEYADNKRYAVSFQYKNCDQITEYWTGEANDFIAINSGILLHPSKAVPSPSATAVFNDEYKYESSDVVQRYMKPGAPTIRIRVVDQTNSTRGIAKALVSLTYEPNDGSWGSINRMTDDNGWITPFVLKPGKNAKVKIIANGYNFYTEDINRAPVIRIPGGNEPPASCAGCQDCICIGGVMLGQNSNYSAVLMRPNTHIVGRAIDYDTKSEISKSAGALLTGNPVKVISQVPEPAKTTTATKAQSVKNAGVETVGNKIVTGKNLAAKKQVATSIKPVTELINNNAPETGINPKGIKNIAGDGGGPEVGSGQSIEAYVQADDGYIFKTEFNNGMWKFDIDAPSTAQTLKIIPVNISYFEEIRNIKTELPKPKSTAGSQLTINAGDINIYQRDHRITFNIFEKGGSSGAVTGALVNVFGKKDPGFVFGPSDAKGVVSTRFKNVSTNNLFVEISATGYVTQTVSVVNEESKIAPAPKMVLLERAATVNGVVVAKTAQGTETPVQGALVFVSAGKNAPVKYSTTSKSDGSFSLDIDKTLTNCTIEASFNPDKTGQTGITYVGTSVSQSIPQAKGQSLKLTLTTFDKFNIASIWGFPVTIEKMDPKTMKVSGVVDLSDPSLGPFGTLNDRLTAKFENVVFKANPDKPTEGMPASETVELQDGTLDQLVYHTTPNIALKDVKFNIRLTSLDNVANAGKFKIIRTPGTSKGKIIAQAKVIDNSFNFSENLFSYAPANELFLYDPAKEPGDKPSVVAFDSEKNNIKWTDFGISQGNGKPLAIKLLAFDAISKLEGSRLVGDEIHLNPVLNCTVKNANPSNLEISIGKLVIKNNTIDKKSGETPLTFPLAGSWSVEVRNWVLDYKKGGFYATTGVVKTGKVDIPIKEFNLRNDFFKLEAEPKDLELAGVAKMELGGKAYFGYDQQTGSDMKGHWAMVVVPEGDSPAAKLLANSLPGLTNDMTFQTVSLLDNGQDVVTFGAGNKSFRYFNIIDVRPTTIATGPDWFEFDSGLTTGIPNAPKDVSMRLRYYKSKETGKPVLQTIVPGAFNFETSGYLNFEALDTKTADGGTSKLFFADGIIAMRGRVKEPEKLEIDNVLLVHTANMTHITHNRSLNLTVEKDLLKLKNNPVYATNDAISNKTDYTNNKLSLVLEGNSGLSDLYCHQSVEGKQWKLMTFSGLPSGFEMWKKDEKNRLTFTAHGEIIADKQNIGLDEIPAPGGLGELSLMYDRKNSRFTGTLIMPPIPIPPTMQFTGGIGQVRVDGNGFYIVASGSLTDVPLPIPTTMRAGLMLGYYNSRDLSDATSVLFANSHRKSLPCTFSSNFKGIYATGELPLPGIGNFDHTYGVPGAQYKVGVDVYADGYVYGNYNNSKLSFGAGMGVGARAYAYGTLMSIEAGGEVYVNGGLDTELQLGPSPLTASLTLSANVGAGFKAGLKETLTGAQLGPFQTDMHLIVTGKAAVTKGSAPAVDVKIDCAWDAKNEACISETP